MVTAADAYPTSLADLPESSAGQRLRRVALSGAGDREMSGRPLA
jgi:hypothetical protein